MEFYAISIQRIFGKYCISSKCNASRVTQHMYIRMCIGKYYVALI